MELRILKCFLTIAREGSITRAANLLHISQPALSRQIINLEEELSCKLFVRNSHSVSLTADGLLLQKRAEEILEISKKTQEEISKRNTETSGEVYIGGGESQGMKYIAKIVHKLQKTNPNIRYNLYSGNAADVMEKLDSGLLDFGLVIHPANISKYSSFDLPKKDRWGVIMRKNLLLAKKHFITIKDLSKLPIIISRQMTKHISPSNVFSEWFGKDIESFNIVGTYNLIYNASHLATEGVGYVLGLDGLLDTGNDSELCFRPLYPKLEATISIVWKKERDFSKSALLFLNELKKYCNVDM